MRKPYVAHIAALNLGLVMRTAFGYGTAVSARFSRVNASLHRERGAEDVASMRVLNVAKLPEFVEEDFRVSEWNTVRSC